MNAKVETAVDKAARLEKANALNNRVLNSCPRHLFDMKGYNGIQRPHSSLKLACVICGGSCSFRSVVRYIAGYVASGRPQADVAFNTTMDKGAEKVLCPRCKGFGEVSAGPVWERGQCWLCDRVGSTNRHAAVTWLNNKKDKTQ